MTWFKATSPVKGIRNVDRDESIIYGVAVNASVEAKGHGVHLDEDFVKSVTEHGKNSNGLKCRFGHPSMSGSAIGTYLGRLHNFRTEYDGDGDAVSRADLHLAESAKKAPKGNLHEYILELAEKDPEMFGMSIAFKSGKTYRKRAGEKVYEGEEGYHDLGESSKTYASLEELHAADVVDTPAATKNGLFSEFTEDISAVKALQFLQENPEIEKILLSDSSTVEAFIERYRSFKSENKEQEKMSEQEQYSDEKVGWFFKGLFNSMFGKGEIVPAADGNKKEKQEVPEPKRENVVSEDDVEDVSEEDEAKGTKPKTKVPEPKKGNNSTAEEADQSQGEEAEEEDVADEEVDAGQAEEASEDSSEDSEEGADEESGEDSELSAANARIVELEAALAEREVELSAANEKLTNLGAGFNVNDDEDSEENESKSNKKFKSLEEALDHYEEKFDDYEKAFKFCAENHRDLYPKAH